MLKHRHTFPGAIQITRPAHTPTHNGYLWLVTAALLGLLSMAPTVASADTLVTVCSFTGAANGNQPNGNLILASNGWLYGTTTTGGAYGFGTVFKMPVGGSSAMNVYSFQGPPNDGAAPAALIQGTDGNLYGITSSGGANNNEGTVFRLALDGSGETILHNFLYSDPVAGGGAFPSSIMQAPDGNLYGTVYEGPANNGGAGSIFRISPDGTFTLLTAFANGADGGYPVGGLIPDPKFLTNGYIYGTTSGGGGPGVGTVFRFRVTDSSLTVFHTFRGADGANPGGTLFAAKDGNLYGTTPLGGANGHGTIFKIPLAGGTLTTVYSFTGGADGDFPQAGLYLLNDGTLCGTTVKGGAHKAGTLFKIAMGNTKLSTVVSLPGQAGGSSPSSSVIQASDGNLYGVCSGGGSNGNGTVFSLRANTHYAWLWGGNSHGQLGTGNTQNASLPLLGSNKPTLQSVAGGLSHTLFLNTDGSVLASGFNTDGELGNLSFGQQTTPVAVRTVAGTPFTNAVSVAAGAYYSLALCSDGTVWAWGDNSWGQLGDGYLPTSDPNNPYPVSDLPNSFVPVQVSGLPPITAIAAGNYHCLALAADGSVWAWGYNFDGELGNYDDFYTSDPVQIFDRVGGQPLGPITAIAAGPDFSMALRTDGTVWTWGSDSVGQLGDGTNNDSPYPAPIPTLSNILQIAAGGTYEEGGFGLARDINGGVFAWGGNAHGQLGTGNTTAHSTPVTVQLPSQRAVAIAAGNGHALAVLTNRTLCAWGANALGQVGNDSTTDIATPTLVPGMASVTSVVAGAQHSVALSGLSSLPLTLANMMITPSTVAGGLTTTATILFNQSAMVDTVVTLASGNTAATVPSSITVKKGMSSANVLISTQAVSKAVAGAISAKYHGTTISAPLIVRPITVKSLTLAPNPVKGGTTVTGTVNLESAAAPGPVTVTLATSNTAVAKPTVASLSIPAGSTTGTFTINTFAVKSNTTINITAKANGLQITTQLSVQH